MKKIVTAISICLFTSVALAQTCTDLVFEGKFPTSKEPVKILCYKKFVVGYSEIRKAPLWAATVLTADSVKNSTVVRKGSFKPDPQIPTRLQPAMSDFVGNDFDRGHMVNFEDLAFDAEGAAESNYLTNIVAQYSSNNRGIWKAVEGRVRKLPETRKLVYVVTGPIFDDRVAKLPGGTPIPAKIFKMTISPSTSESFTVVVPNQPDIPTATLPKYFSSIANLRRANPIVDPLPTRVAFTERKKF